jgi:hypothetical protein
MARNSLRQALLDFGLTPPPRTTALPAQVLAIPQLTLSPEKVAALKTPTAKDIAAAKATPTSRGTPRVTVALPKKLLFTEAIGQEICEQLARGVSSVTICKALGLPSSVVALWVRDYPDFADAYEHARLLQADYYAAQCIDISDEADVTVQYLGQNVKLELDGAAIARNRLRIDARKWYAAKLNQKRYGDSSSIALSGTIETRVEPDKLKAEILSMLTKVGGSEVYDVQPKA